MSTSKKKTSQKPVPVKKKVKASVKAKAEEFQIDPKKAKELQDIIDQIGGIDKEIEDGKENQKQNQNSSVAKIGRLLRDVEKTGLYKQGKNEEGAPCQRMSEFIHANFERKYQYYVMLKGTAYIEDIVDPELKLNLSYGLLRKLNRYRKDEKAVLKIWGNAKKASDESVPTYEVLQAEIEKWQKDNPVKPRGKQKSTWDELIKDEKTTLKCLCNRLAKLTEDERKKISKETQDGLSEKVKTLLKSEIKPTRKKVQNSADHEN